MALNGTRPDPTGEKQDTRFKPGQSGNPAGRPKGSRNKVSECWSALPRRRLKANTRVERRQPRAKADKIKQLKAAGVVQLRSHDLRDEYAAALHELVQAKLEQRAPEITVEAKGEAPKVINIMAALKESIQFQRPSES